MEITPTCLVCAGNAWSPLYDNTLLKCSQCGFVTANLQVSESELRSIYSHKYFHGEEYENYTSDKHVFRYNFNKRLKFIEQKIAPNRITNSVEIGCAYGYFGELLFQKYPRSQYIGFDVSHEAIKHANNDLKLNATTDPFDSYNLPFRPTDVFMWDVIEHLNAPQDYIEKISKSITPEGRLYITTGDIDAFLPRWRKAKWRMIHPPTHLHYFSRKTLEALLNNHGFKVISVTYPSVSRSVKQMFYGLFLLNKRPGKLRQFVYNNIPKRWKIPINTRDILFLIAVKTKE